MGLTYRLVKPKQRLCLSFPLYFLKGRRSPDFREWKNTNKKKVVGNVKSKQEAKYLPFQLGHFVTGQNGVNQALGNKE